MYTNELQSKLDTSVRPKLDSPASMQADLAPKTRRRRPLFSHWLDTNILAYSRLRTTL